jgi:ankyrin repeat protein
MLRGPLMNQDVPYFHQTPSSPRVMLLPLSQIPSEFSLMRAVRDLDVARCRQILEINPLQGIQEVDPLTARTPLHWGCLQANTEIVKLLLQHDALVNKQDLPTGWTALHIAVLTLNPHLCELLLSRGADPAIRDADGKSCFDLICDLNEESLLDIFRSYLENPTAFTCASMRRPRSGGMLLGNLPSLRLL